MTWWAVFVAGVVFNLLRGDISSVCVFCSFGRRAIPRGVNEWSDFGRYADVLGSSMLGVEHVLRRMT